MKLLLSELNQSDCSVRILDDGWFPVGEIDLLEDPAGTLNVRAKHSGSSEAARVTGVMTCTVSLPCDRCCRPVRLELRAELDYECILGSEDIDEVRHETECREEEINRMYLEEPVIDLGSLCREQVYLALPSRMLCDDACRGLCPVCGADLNDKQCDCEQESSASPFSILSTLSDR